MAKPTVRPIATDMSCNAVWKPDRYVVVDEDPEVELYANERRPPFPRPEGSWNRIPVI